MYNVYINNQHSKNMSTVRVPVVGSKIKVRTRYSQGPAMIPPQPAFHEHEGDVVKPYPWLTDRQFCMTGDAAYPVRIISLDLVENIELLSGKFKEINTEAKTYQVDGSKGKKYTVVRDSKGWTCTCTGFQFRKSCKHVSELSGVK